MKKLIATLLAASTLVCASLGFAACGGNYDEAHTIVVGATSQPHAEILEAIKDDLKEQGYKLEVKVYSDYSQLNPALVDGDLDANYFQHITYLNDYNKANGTDLVSAATIHYEPFGLWGKKIEKSDYTADFDKTGRKIFVPNDTTNETRALLLLQQEGFITLSEGSNPTSELSILDIVDDKGNDIEEVAAAGVPSQLLGGNDGELAVVNGNYALESGLFDNKDVANLAFESKTGDIPTLYANVVAVRKGDEQSDKIKALVAAIKTQKVLDFIAQTYKGSVQALFTV